MAYRTQCKCYECGSVWEDSVGSGLPEPKVCPTCIQCKEDIARNEYFSDLDQLTIEQRLRLIEEWIFNYRKYRVEHWWDVRF